jgi:hypothetical protein
MNKEQVYDESISPLVAEIIRICKANGIAMIANFACPNDEQEDLQALTFLPDENGNHPENHVLAHRAIRPPRFSSFVITTNSANGDVLSKEMVVVAVPDRKEDV